VSRHNEHSIKDAIQKLLKVYKLDDKLAERRLISSWEEVMGKMIANHTKDLYVRNKQLFVTLDSSALRNELAMAKSKIIKMMNEAAGSDVINDVVLK
jgi:predicted nucleic acid-binding Zn ribbon protein